MAYNNFFPTSYQNPYYQQLIPAPQPMQNQQMQNNIIWVSGIAGSKSYMVAPNTTVQLWDSEAQVIYLKSADASGMPSMKIIDYTIRDTNTPATPINTNNANPTNAEYVTKNEFDLFKSEVNKILGGMNNEPTVSANE